MPTSIPIFALTTHGLEAVSACELRALPGLTVTQTTYRRIAAICSAPLTGLPGLRTVDDVFLDVATWQYVGHTRDALARLSVLSAALDLRPAHAACAGVRPVEAPPSFAMTASFVGRRNYSAAEIKSAVAAGIARGHGWSYRDDDRRADLNVRLFVVHEVAYVGVRLGKTPLHERCYRLAHRPGALKPPVAAALLALAGIEPGMRVLDPCCGTGTIVIEAAERGAMAQGGDSDPDAVAAARLNAAHAGIAASFRVMDARQLPLAAESIDRIVANLPWGRQTSAGPSPALFYRRSLAECRRVLAPDGRIALLTDAPDLVRPAGMRCAQRLDISLFGRRPSILVYDRE